MSNTRRPPKAPGLYYQMIAEQVERDGLNWTQSVTEGTELEDTVVGRWVRSVSRGRSAPGAALILPACPHWKPGQPGALNVDDPDPRVRCLPCSERLNRSLGDDGICHLCNRPATVFAELAVDLNHGLIVRGNACTRCLSDDHTFALGEGELPKQVSESLSPDQVRSRVASLTVDQIAGYLAREAGHTVVTPEDRRAAGIAHRGIAQEAASLTDEEWARADEAAESYLSGLPTEEFRRRRDGEDL